MKTFAIPAFILILLCCACESNPAVEESTDEKALVLGMFLSTVDLGSRGSATRAALEEVNQAGGINGYTLKLDMREHGESNADVTGFAQNLVGTEPDLVGFITSWSSRSRAVTLEVGEPGGIPTISGSSTANANSGLSPFFHRTAPPDKYQIAVLADQARANGAQRIAIATQSNDTYTEGLSSDLISFIDAEDRGVAVTNQVMFDLRESRFSDKIEALFSEEPDAVFVAIITPELVLDMFTAIDEAAGIDVGRVRFMIPDALMEAFLLTSVSGNLLLDNPAASPRVIGTVPGADSNTEVFRHFAAELEVRLGFSEPPSFGANFYDIGYIFALAVQDAFNQGFSPEADMVAFRAAVNDSIRHVSSPQAGDTTVTPIQGWPAMRDALAAGGVNYDGASGPVDMDGLGDVRANYNIWKVVEGVDGTRRFEIIQNVEPPE